MFVFDELLAWIVEPRRSFRFWRLYLSLQIKTWRLRREAVRMVRGIARATGQREADVWAQIQGGRYYERRSETR